MMKECKVEVLLFSFIHIRLPLLNVFVHSNAARLCLTAFAKEASCTVVTNRAGRGSPVVSTSTVFFKKKTLRATQRFFKFFNKDIKRDHDPTASLVHSLRNFAAAVLYLKRAQLHRGRKQGGVSQSSVCNVDESEMHNFFNENMVSFQNKNSYKGLCRAGKG